PEGFETGVGPEAILFGGFIVLTDEIQLVKRAAIPERYNVVIAIPKTNVSATEEAAGEGEKALLLGEERRLDNEDAGVKSHIMLIDLIPCVSGGDGSVRATQCQKCSASARREPKSSILLTS
ncbi:MAG: hypothetical protein ACXV5T_01225, partial [Halobacteriota archaeon]